MEEISAAAEEQTASMEEITSTVHKLGTKADELMRLLNTKDTSVVKKKIFKSKKIKVKKKDI